MTLSEGVVSTSGSFFDEHSVTKTIVWTDGTVKTGKIISYISPKVVHIDNTTDTVTFTTPFSVIGYSSTYKTIPNVIIFSPLTVNTQSGAMVTYTPKAMVYNPPGHAGPTFTITGLPPGLSFSAGAISGRPTTSGTFATTILAESGIYSDTRTLIFNVAALLTSTPVNAGTKEVVSGTVSNILSGIPHTIVETNLYRWFYGFNGTGTVAGHVEVIINGVVLYDGYVSTTTNDLAVVFQNPVEITGMISIQITNQSSGAATFSGSLTLST
jgi:hypothetical protein